MISTSGHLIPKFPEVRFHRTRIFNKPATNIDLYPKEEIISSKLFGDGEENEIFRDSLGDYLAIAKTDKALLYIGSEALKSHHAGYTEDEIYVPLIVINRVAGH